MFFSNITFAANAINPYYLIHEEQNEFGPLSIFQDSQIRCMSFEKFDIKVKPKLYQTCIFQQAPLRSGFAYTNEILAILFINPHPEKILILGLGGGTIPRQLNFLLPNAKIDSVEINPAVISSAKTYFYFEESEKLKIYNIDGFDYVKNYLNNINNNKTSNKYDLIIIDTYNDTGMPKKFLTDKFVINLKNILSNNGIVAVNTLPDISDNKGEDIEGNLYKKIFGEFYTVGSNNRLIIVSNSDLPSKDVINKNASIWDNYFRFIGVDYRILLTQFKKF